MYKYLTKIKQLSLRGLFFLLLQNSVFSYNLTEEISSIFEKISSVEDTYSAKFSKDPFGDAMSNIDNTSNQLKIAWVQYIENSLSNNGCSMSDKKILALLYYFVPEFRTDLTRSLKTEIWNFDSKQYSFNKDTISNYCKEYFTCMESQWQSREKTKIWDTSNTNNSTNNTTSSEPADIESNCKEFFQRNYREWSNNEQIKQNMQMTDLWSNIYWDKSTENSPYDIMSDLWILAKLLYQDAQEPITAHYNIPNFSNSNNKSNNKNSSNKNTNSSNTETSLNSNSWKQRDWSQKTWTTNNNWWSNENNSSSTNYEYDTEWWYEKLIEWLNSSQITNNSIIKWNLCEDNDNETENEKTTKGSTSDKTSFSELEDEEYQKMIDYMLNSVDKYLSLPEDKEQEISEIVWDSNKNGWIWLEDQRKDTAEKIKKCWESCDGLRVDQKASCMLKCACGEIKSPIFNPEDTPWLWPIYTIRFCSIPAVDTKFSVGWKRIHSIEEWLREIYWVNDKLSREWRLWKWTQQNEFLDSSTKQMSFADSFAFTINIELVDISNRISSHSNQYKEKKTNINNEARQLYYWISNPLDNPSTKNSYILIWWENTNYNAPEPLADVNKNSNAYRYNSFSEYLNKWMDQQWNLRTKTYKNIVDIDSYTASLLNKKCK